MSLAWRLALRDLRGGLGALRLLAACLFLGVAAIAGVGSLSAAIVAGLASEGRTILGGDVAVSLTQRRASDAERAAIDRLGRVAESARMQAMASRGEDGDATLVELKAVDAAYPLAGRLRLAPGALAALPGPGQAMVAPALVDRLGLHVGDRLRIGEAALTVAGVIAAEPDQLGDGFSLGPTVLTSMAGLKAARLIQPGSLYSWRYKVVLPPGSDAKAAAARLGRAFPRAGWELRDSGNAAPGTRRFVEQIGQFLGLVGLTALVVAGIGVGNGVAAYLEALRPGIATLKTLGASSPLILRVYLIEIGLVAAGAVAAALVAGALLPAAVAGVAGDALPAPPRLGLYPLPLAMAAIEGLLVAAGFAIVPLARARAVSAASLFRGAVDGEARPPWRVLAGVAGAILLAAAIAVAGARQPWFAASFLAAAAALTGLLAALGAGVRAVAARLPRSRHPLLRLAVANLHAPAAQTGRLVVALGLGLSLFATLAVIQTNLSGQIRSTVPARAPSFFVLDIPGDGLDRFRALAARYAPAGDLVTVPSLRGPVVALNGRRVAEMKDIPEGAWILRGDRGLTFARDLPAGSTLTAGRWWAKDYAGPPLVSIDEDAAHVLKLRLGDEITVSALGVEVAARIASFRRIDWQTMGFNFVLVYSPGTFDGAPFGTMATLALPPAREAAFSRAATRAFPSLSLIRVRDVLATVGDLLGQMASAVAAASAVALAAGIAVLIGAVLASRRARVRDAVLLKLLGATRGQVLLVQGIEYGLLAVIVTLVALAVGAGAGWYVVTRIFALPWGPDWGVVALVLLAGAGLTLATGLIGALPALAARPAPALRNL